MVLYQNEADNIYFQHLSMLITKNICEKNFNQNLFEHKTSILLMLYKLFVKNVHQLG